MEQAEKRGISFVNENVVISNTEFRKDSELIKPYLDEIFGLDWSVIFLNMPNSKAGTTLDFILERSLDWSKYVFFSS
jgi:hypothetical protein